MSRSRRGAHNEIPPWLTHDVLPSRMQLPGADVIAECGATELVTFTIEAACDGWLTPCEHHWTLGGRLQWPFVGRLLFNGFRAGRNGLLERGEVLIGT